MQITQVFKEFMLAIDAKHRMIAPNILNITLELHTMI